MRRVPIYVQKTEELLYEIIQDIPAIGVVLRDNKQTLSDGNRNVQPKNVEIQAANEALHNRRLVEVFQSD